MRVDRVVLKSVLSTLAAVVVLCCVMFATMIVAFPATMMELTYNFGLNSASAWFADRAYRQNDNVYYLDFATNAAIAADDVEATDYYGCKFIADDRFSEFCAAMDEKLGIEGASAGSYEQYVCGKVYVAKYRVGDFENALLGAFSTTEQAFPKGNAVVALMFDVLQNGNKEELQSILDGMCSLRDSAQTKQFVAEDIDYLDSLISLLGERMDKLS